MTTYYIELFQFSNDADISKISTNTLKEVINDFTNELNKRGTEQNLNIHNVGGPASECVSEGEQLPAEGQGEANMSAGRAVCPKCGKNFYAVTKLWNHLDRCSG